MTSCFELTNRRDESEAALTNYINPCLSVSDTPNLSTRSLSTDTERGKRSSLSVFTCFTSVFNAIFECIRLISSKRDVWIHALLFKKLLCRPCSYGPDRDQHCPYMLLWKKKKDRKKESKKGNNSTVKDIQLCFMSFLRGFLLKYMYRDFSVTKLVTVVYSDYILCCNFSEGDLVEL